MPVVDVTHPLVKHKIGLLREVDISTKKFRELTGELARLLAYEATVDFPLEKTTIQCWSGPVEIDQISGKKVTVVPILRAGIGMLDGGDRQPPQRRRLHHPRSRRRGGSHLRHEELIRARSPRRARRAARAAPSGGTSARRRSSSPARNSFASTARPAGPANAVHRA